MATRIVALTPSIKIYHGYKYGELWFSEILLCICTRDGCTHGKNTHVSNVSSRLSGLIFAKLSTNIDG